MASYTDKAPEFNAYVGTQPIEAMVKVGMAKQQQYDQGVQKIQESYNKIAGLDIMKETDRAYMNSKLTETTSKLKKFAAGDFSSAQLTNSVSGMITGISKDENIRNSVFATAKARRELRTAADAEKAGKSSIVNQWALQTEVSDWMNDGKVGSTFNGKYTPYTDVDKKLMDVYDKMDDIERQTDNPYVRDSSGQTVFYSPDGKRASTTQREGWKPQVDQAMLRRMIKGKSSSKIMQNFKSSLSEDDVNQLSLNAKYHYRNTDSETLKGEFSKRVNAKKAEYTKTIGDIAIELETNTDLTAEQKEMLRARMKTYKTTLDDGTLDKELQEGLQKLNDPNALDHFKYQIYTENYLNDKSKALETQSIKETYETNPYFKAQMDLKNLKFKYDDAARKQKNADRLYGLEVAKFQYKKQSEQDANGIYVTDAAIPTEDADGKFTTTGLQKDLADLIGTKEDIDRGGYGSSGALGELNRQYAHVVPPTLNPKQKIEYLNNLAETYMHNPNSINSIDNPDIRAYVQKRFNIDKQIARKQGLYKTVVEHEGSQQFDKAIDDSLSSMGNITDDKGIQYTAKEILDFSANAKDVTTVEGFGRHRYRKVDGEALMRKYKGTRYEHLAEMHIRAHGQFGAERLRDSEKDFYSQFVDVKNAAQESAGEIRDKQEEWRAEYIRKHSPEAQQQVGVIANTNKKATTAAKAYIQQAVNNIANREGGLDNYEEGDFNPTTAMAALKDAQAGYVITKNFDGSGFVEVQSGATINRVPISATDMRTFFPTASQSNPLNEAKQLIESSPTHSTNLNGVDGSPEAAVTAYFNGSQLPNIAGTKLENKVRMDIVGEFTNDGGPNDRYYMRLYYLNGDRWITDHTSNYKSLAGVQAEVYAVNESTINSMIKDHNNPNKQ
jgi:hypothetical protein